MGRLSEIKHRVIWQLKEYINLEYNDALNLELFNKSLYLNKLVRLTLSRSFLNSNKLHGWR